MAARRKWNFLNISVECMSSKMSDGQEIMQIDFGMFSAFYPKSKLSCIPELFSRVDISVDNGVVRGIRLANKTIVFWMDDAELQAYHSKIARVIEHMKMLERERWFNE